MPAAFSDSARRESLTRSSVMPGCPPQPLRFAALAVGQAQDAHPVSAFRIERDRASGGRHTKSAAWALTTRMVWPGLGWSAIVFQGLSPDRRCLAIQPCRRIRDRHPTDFLGREPVSSSTCGKHGEALGDPGLMVCPRSVETIQRSAPTLRMLSKTTSQGAFPVYMVVKQCSIRAPTAPVPPAPPG